MRLLVGIVKKLVDVGKSVNVIRFSIPQLIENIDDGSNFDVYPIAFPLSKPIASPQVGDEIIVFQPDEKTDLFYYSIGATQSGDDILELRSGNTSIGIKIKNKHGSEDPTQWDHDIILNVDNGKSIITLNGDDHADGDKQDINISSTSGDVNITVSNGHTVNINGGTYINDTLNVTSTSTLGSGASGSVVLNTPTAIGKTTGFCMIPNCIYSGVPHVIDRCN